MVAPFRLVPISSIISERFVSSGRKFSDDANGTEGLAVPNDLPNAFDHLVAVGGRMSPRRQFRERYERRAEVAGGKVKSPGSALRHNHSDGCNPFYLGVLRLIQVLAENVGVKLTVVHLQAGLW